jgi:glycosyltransferase involved in cell wall biosynthesis
MNIVFIHQNFPGQFRHIAHELACNPENKVYGVCQAHAPKMANVDSVVYAPATAHGQSVNRYLDLTQRYVLNGHGVIQGLLRLKEINFHPDVIIAHTGWGEALFVKEVFPDTPLIGFFEFYFHIKGADVGFDPEQPLSADDRLIVRVRNSINLLSLQTTDAGIAPTRWQRSLFPPEYQAKLRLIHEGVNVSLAVADTTAKLELANGLVLDRNHEVITYVARNLEPYRGFHIFMRAVAEICKRRPHAHVLIVGGDEVSYGVRLANAQTYREKSLSELDIDLQRVHFLGHIPYLQYLKVVQLSAVHIYLTVPFVLSWSMLEAMSAQCLVIGSDTPPVAEVLKHGKNGLLVNFFSATAIADAVDSVFNHPDQMQSLRLAARQTVLHRYALSRGIDAYQALLAEVVSGQLVATQE